MHHPPGDPHRTPGTTAAHPPTSAPPTPPAPPPSPTPPHHTIHLSNTTPPHRTDAQWTVHTTTGPHRVTPQPTGFSAALTWTYAWQLSQIGIAWARVSHIVAHQTAHDTPPTAQPDGTTPPPH